MKRANTVGKTVLTDLPNAGLRLTSIESVMPSSHLILCRPLLLLSQRWISSIQSAKTRLGADCDSDYELLIAKFRLKLKKVGKTTRPFRSIVAQLVKNRPVMQETWVQSLGWEDPLEKGKATHSSILA